MKGASPCIVANVGFPSRWMFLPMAGAALLATTREATMLLREVWVRAVQFVQAPEKQSATGVAVQASKKLDGKEVSEEHPDHAV